MPSPLLHVSNCVSISKVVVLRLSLQLSRDTDWIDRERLWRCDPTKVQRT